MKRFFLIVCCIALLLPPGVFAQTAEDTQLQELRQRLEELQAEQERIRLDLNATQAQKQTLQQKVNDLQYQIRLVENQISATNTQIGITQGEISQTQDTIEQTRSEMSRKRETIGRMILFLEQRDREDLVASLFKYSDLSEFFRQLDDAAAVQERLLNTVNDLKEDKASLESYQASLETKEGDLRQLSTEASIRRNQIASVRNQQAVLLAQTKGQEAQYQNQLSETEALQRQVNLEIYKIEERLRRNLDPDSQPRAQAGVLEWPVQGTITQRYGCIQTAFARRSYSDCNGGKGGFHNGLDIAAPYGTILHAADDGTVVGVGNAPYAYGNWVAIEHSNGLVTVYGHMAAYGVSVGQIVLRGDAIGSMGTSGLSTGSHVHFMVYAPKTFTTQPSSISGTLPIGATLNPSDYL